MTIPVCELLFEVNCVYYNTSKAAKHPRQRDKNALVFVGSRACAANHYVIVEKCGYPKMYVHIFGERRCSEQLPIWSSLWLSENCRNPPGMTLVMAL